MRVCHPYAWAHHERAMTLLASEIDDDFAVNLLTLAEILVAPTRAGRTGAVLSILDDLSVASRIDLRRLSVGRDCLLRGLTLG